MKLRSIISKRKGNVTLDGLTLVVMLIVFAVTCFVCWKVFNGVNASIQASDTMAQVSKDIMNKGSSLNHTFDTMFIIFFFGLWIGSLVGAFFIDTHPVYFIVSLILISILVIVGAVLTNSVEPIIDSDSFSVRADFPYSTFVLTHLVELLLAFGFSVSIALFIKPTGFSNGGGVY